MHSYRLRGRDGRMLRNSNTVIGRTVNAKSNKFAFSPSQLRPVFLFYSLQPVRQCYGGKLFHPIQ